MKKYNVVDGYGEPQVVTADALIDAVCAPWSSGTVEDLDCRVNRLECIVARLIDSSNLPDAVIVNDVCQGSKYFVK